MLNMQVQLLVVLKSHNSQPLRMTFHGLRHGQVLHDREERHEVLVLRGVPSVGLQVSAREQHHHGLLSLHHHDHGSYHYHMGLSLVVGCFHLHSSETSN
jgi:hypothetical protein